MEMLGIAGWAAGGIAVAVLLGWRLWSRKNGSAELPGMVAELNAELAAARTENENLKQQFASERELLRQQFEREKTLLQKHGEEILQNRQDAFQTARENLERVHAAELQNQQQLAAAERNARESAFAAERKALLQSEAEVKAQFARSMEALEKTHQARLAAMKEEFKTLSSAILEDRSGKLHEANKKQMEAILTPLSEKLGEFRKAVEESKTKGVELNAALSTQLKEMMAATSRIGGEARELVNALRGQQKTQGDWGEMILDEILQSSGLQKGVHYEAQTALRDTAGNVVQHEENGQTMRPDVIVHYPDGKDVIIDSKVSLTSYVDYMNAEDEESRKRACARHLLSVKKHVEELHKKDYVASNLKSGRDTVDFVVMFIPNEGPFHLAMIADPALWVSAFRSKVLMVSPVNLMALLRIIQIAWTRYEQNRNQEKILHAASMLLDRVYKFYEFFDAVGDGLKEATQQYELALHKLKDGRQCVVGAGKELQKLGVSSAKNKEYILPLRLEDAEPEEPETPPEPLHLAEPAPDSGAAS